MNPNQRSIDPRGPEVSTALRVVGLSMVVLGGILTLIGVTSFFSAFGTFGPPRYFWCAFLGLPLLGFGLQISGLGFLGPFTRYVSGQTAPVQRDTFNYLADGTTEGVRNIATAAAQGFSAGASKPTAANVAACPHCHALNPHAARFCDQCGTAFGAKSCPRCRHENDADARFCSQCGCEVV